MSQGGSGYIVMVTTVSSVFQKIIKHKASSLREFLQSLCLALRIKRQM